MEDRTIKVGLLGCGVVGGSTAWMLEQHRSEIGERAGGAVELVRVAVKDLDKPRTVELPEGIWTTDAAGVANDPDIDLVVEAIGGVGAARELILQAVASGKHVVTANKELLAAFGAQIMDVAEETGVDVLFEAAVGGGIPVVRPMKESLAGDKVTKVIGIVNGTTNFILTRMSETGETFHEALGEAERLGYTELDPSADIDGHDAASKLAILASLAFHARVTSGDVHREGISKVTPEDITAAHDLGYEIKLLAVAEIDDGAVSARVHPAMIPLTHPLAAVRDVYNAVFVEAENAGELMFFGRGAGGGPTASAVVGDIVEIARNIRAGGRSIGSAYYRQPARMKPRDDSKVRYYALLSVADESGVLASIASVFARYDVSIASVRQEGYGDSARLMVITHAASEGNHRSTFEELGSVDTVKDIVSRMRVEGTEES